MERGNQNYLATCSICHLLYNEGEHQPTALSCSHTFCQTCVNQSTISGTPTVLACPVCKILERAVTLSTAASQHGQSQSTFYTTKVQELEEKEMQALALLVEKQKLDAELQIVKARIQENNCGMQKLKTLRLMYEELRQLPPHLKATRPVIDMVKQLHEAVKEENIEAAQMLQLCQQYHQAH